MNEDAVNAALDCHEKAIVFLLERKFEEVLAEANKADAILRGLEEDDKVISAKALCLEVKSVAYNSLGREEEASATIQAAREMLANLKSEGPDASMAMTLHELGKIDEAVACADKAFELLSGETGLNAGIHLIGLSQVYMGDLERSYKKAKKAILLGRAQMQNNSLLVVNMLIEAQHSLAYIEFKCLNNWHKAIAELKKGWDLAVGVGLGKCDLESLLSLVAHARQISDQGQDDYWQWVYRSLEICGVYIDKGAPPYAKVSEYVESNVQLFTAKMFFNNSVTVERALKALEITEKASENKMDIAMARWLAGCVLYEKVKTREAVRKSIRLIKKSLPVFKETNNALDTLIVAVGEGYIADYHFQKEEYDLAAYWYQAAKNDYSASNLVKDSEYDKRFSKGLVDSLMRMV